MKFLTPTHHRRLNEATGVVLLFGGVLIWLSLISYRPDDPSLNTAAGSVRPVNLIGVAGAYVSDLLLQCLGLTAYFLPVLLFLLAWKWIRSEPLDTPGAKLLGAAVLLASLSVGLSLAGPWLVYGGAIHAGGMAGLVLAGAARAAFNLTGAALITLAVAIVSIYLLTAFSMSAAASWVLRPVQAVGGWWRGVVSGLKRPKTKKPAKTQTTRIIPDPEPEAEDAPELPFQEIPICPLDEDTPPWEEPEPARTPEVQTAAYSQEHPVYVRPSTSLLNEAAGRPAYDEVELQDIAVRVKAKFEEFNVRGSVVQINPGPVVTTFEFKPDAGMKYSRITTLSEDLCLGLQAESILIERIPGKPTVGIEVPNTRREVISLRQMIESDEFRNAPSKLTISLGKDINGRMKVAALESMPHLLIAGSTGAGKSVMINSMIMSILYKSTPDEVRMIMVDPKRLELGLYEGIPHLLTPVITDAKKATNALKNAVVEMERRLRLLAEYGVRNITQFNERLEELRQENEGLNEAAEDLRPLPYILILIDELADLMILEGRNVEESVTRLAQMARAVGMHLVLATQRPSVDVITGLIKANFPARISFRVATRVDSRTILDTQGAEHLLGKGDMLFLPPGSSRLVRVHGAFVTETEINRVVSFWKAQAQPEYDDSFLAPPPGDEEGGKGEAGGDQDPAYEDAVRVILDAGKASTSILQRRLRLGYGRAARILDMMHRDGIIGPPDGSRPREVLKRPDWIHEVEDTLR